jgi:CHAT domain-containing protein
VRKHFPDAAETVIAKERATPVAYLKSDPGQYGFIHFVAHGTASRLSPLDSAVVLSRATSEEDSFKLYARDIVKQPLRAELVTISTCYGAGSRAYTGEGLVGLSWAFLRAGAHNVIGALWEVSDVSTPALMEQMYQEIGEGKPPESALRDAKLSFLRGTAYRKPFYWAPFQLYTGS